MKILQQYFILLIFISAPVLCYAQKYPKIYNTGNNSYELSLIEKKIHAPEIQFHTNVRPYVNTPAIYSITDSAYKNLFPKQNFFHNDSSVTGARGNAFFNLMYGYEPLIKNDIYETYAAPQLSAYYKNKLFLNIGGIWAPANYASFVDTFVRYTSTSPGIGTAYNIRYTDAHKGGHIYSFNFTGYLSYSPNKVFNLQAGKDKHFWGDGYRSLFISDFAPVYPFLKTTATVWKIKYTSMYAILKDAAGAGGIKENYRNKYATFHFLSWNITRRINVGFFESIIWQGTDDNRSRSYDINYLNPVIFFRPVEYSLGSSDNAFLGFSFKVKAFKKQLIYGQLLLDEFLLKEVKARTGWWANKQGVQLGFRSFDLFKINDLNLRLEGNYVRPYTYSHGSVQQSYGHINHPLAHPLGANFIEGVGILNYRYKKISFELKATHAIYGADSAGYNMGKNIFQSYAARPRDYGNFTTQGIKTNLTTIGASVNYMLYVTRPVYAEAGLIYRKQSSVLQTQNTPYFFLSLKAPLWNEYRDF